MNVSQHRADYNSTRHTSLPRECVPVTMNEENAYKEILA